MLVAGRSNLLLLRRFSKEWIFRVPSFCFYMILTDSYLLYLDNLSFFGRSYNNFHIWEMFPFLWTWCKLWHYFAFQSFVQSNFSRQPIAVSEVFATLKWFSQTRRLAMLIPLNNFPRQSLIIKRNLLHLNCFHRQALLSMKLVFVCK